MHIQCNYRGFIYRWVPYPVWWLRNRNLHIFSLFKIVTVIDYGSKYDSYITAAAISLIFSWNKDSVGWTYSLYSIQSISFAFQMTILRHVLFTQYRFTPTHPFPLKIFFFFFKMTSHTHQMIQKTHKQVLILQEV